MGLNPVDISADGVDFRSIDSTDSAQIEKVQQRKLDDKKDFNLMNRNFIKYMSNYYIDTKKKKLMIYPFNKTRLFDFNFIELSYLEDEPIYVIDYFPKSSKISYKGRLYIHADEFALLRIDYQSTEPLRDFNLFGVSFKVFNRYGTRMFKKNHDGKYDLYFSENFYERSFGLDRPLKIIEKNKNVKGRRKQNQLNMDIIFRGNSKIKTQYIVLNSKKLIKKDFEAYNQIESEIPVKLIKYDSNFWNGFNIIEPSQIIKDFKIEKN